MAKLNVNYNLKVHASSVVEVIVAMVLIISIFGIALMIYNNVLHLALSEKKLKAEGILQQLLLSEENKSDIYNKNWQMPDFTIVEKVEPFEGNEDLVKVSLTAFDADRNKIAEIQKVLFQEKQND